MADKPLRVPDLRPEAAGVDPTGPISDRWDDRDAPADPIDQLLYRSHLLGADQGITNYAGGNTSAKVQGTDPVTGEPIDVLWVKGSGGDLGTLTRDGLAQLNNRRVVALERTYRGRLHEDEQVALLADCLVGARLVVPSIDTPLHALVPHSHVDHVHPDAVIAFATAEDGAEQVRALYGESVGWLDWQRPGYDLALKLRALIADRPQLRGVVLGAHGLICWGNDAGACYRNTIALIEQARAHLANCEPRVFPQPHAAQSRAGTDVRRRAAAKAFPTLRGLAGSDGWVVGHYRDDAVVLEFLERPDVARLVREGTSCPDHFLRTKQRPLLLDVAADTDLRAERARVAASFDSYRARYAEYYRHYALSNSPPMRSPRPVVVLWRGIGMFTFASTKREARIASEFYLNAIHVMRGAELLSRYHGLPDPEAFGVEYWSLEEAKRRQQPVPRPLTGRVALVTGGAGGIGEAIARRFAAEGACVVVADIDRQSADALAGALGESALGVSLDVSDEDSVVAALETAALAFGGVDLLVNNAGISLSKPLLETEPDAYDRVHRVISRGSFVATRAFARQASAAGSGGDIVYIVSKNAVVAGPANIAYSTAKAAQLQQMRAAAVDLAPLRIRVNAINPDAVIQGSKIFAGDWGDNRAATYGVPREQLGQYYAERTLLKQEILPADIAAAAFVLVSGQLSKTTGAVLPVDGGVPAAFLR